MSKVEEIERLIEQLPSENFKELAEWMEQRRELNHSVMRDHSAFLKSYAPSDEGLYDDAVTAG